MGLLDGLFKSDTSNKGKAKKSYDLVILDEVGSGSYGTVHLTQLRTIGGSSGGDDDEASQDVATKYTIAKRAWIQPELQALAEAAAQSATESIDADPTSTGPHKVAQKSKLKQMTDEERIRERAERCEYYLNVEEHCLTKLGGIKDAKPYVPNLIITCPDDDNRNWLVFDLVEASTGRSTSPPTPAKTLSDILELDWIDQHSQDEADPNSHHHLYVLQRELGMEESSSFEDVLDVTLVELLKCISSVNNANVCHRDVKPGNLIVKSTAEGDSGFVLIDFGSAADIDPPTDSATTAFSSVVGGSGGRVGLEDDGRVALSPIYAAPEMFVRWDRSPCEFDSFSTALVFTQLLFNLLDERADAAYRQQLQDVDFNLDAWLQRELNAELQPEGIEDAIQYLSKRPGLWAVLRNMLHPNPERRLPTGSALKQVEDVMDSCREGKVVDIEKADGKYFAGVVATFDQCELPDSGSAVGVVPQEDKVPTTRPEPSSAEQALVIPRPLHFVATFERSDSLGLLLSEVDANGEYDDDLSEEDTLAWNKATKGALPGEVYVRGVVEGGQAEKIGVFEVGDRLMGVGEFPFIAEGFNVVIEMLQRQPPSVKTVTLHFDRKSIGRAHAYERAAPHLAKVIGQGAWSARGRRKTQEDRFVLQEIHDGENAALLTGVFDGHGGDSASTTLAQLLPSLFSVELAGILSKDRADGKASSSDLCEAMESAYEITCRTYRDGCDAEGLCTADYDPREGIVVAGTAATDLIAGSTVATAVLSVTEEGADVLNVLNCGDSRTLVVGRPRGGSPKDSVVHFSTRDHSPSCEIEMERLARGKDRGYSQPQCSMSRWRMKVGDYQYALARSLEGSFATSKGIVSDPDISTVDLSEMLAERELGCIILATDGLFEVIDNEEAGRYAIKWREGGQAADEVAKQLCLRAVDKGSPDNVSCVVLYLD
jgi:serine/threonine protein phosphatase PrpC/serine/threonine protein kinase